MDNSNLNNFSPAVNSSLKFFSLTRTHARTREECVFWNEMKWNEMIWNVMKWNEMKWNDMEWNEMGLASVSDFLPSLTDRLPIDKV